METHEEAVARIIKMADERGDFVALEDGYVHYWPSQGSRGALSSWVLRMLADECDKRNAVWDATIQVSLPKPCVQVWKFADAPEQFRALSAKAGAQWIALVPPGLTGDIRHVEEFNYLVDCVPCPQFPDFEVWIGTPPRLQLVKSNG
jgi:hypothetical protein